MLLTFKTQDTPLNEEAEMLVSKTLYMHRRALDLFLTTSQNCQGLAARMPVSCIMVFPTAS